ncbi:hypothetical protein ABK040_006327 [Willaertia magna]
MSSLLSSTSNSVRSNGWERFVEVGYLGSGAYSTVTSAIDKTTNKLVAIKKIDISNNEEGIPIPVLREINHLKTLNHENIVGLVDIFMSEDDSKICMVLEYIPHDLSGIINGFSDHLSEAFVKSVMKQLLEAVACIHEHHSIHCDLKTSNIFVHPNGQCKVGDFNLSRFIHPVEMNINQYYSRNVITLWYRPPELLLDPNGRSAYGSEVDIWSVGCIMAELLLRQPIFPGNDENEQLQKIFSLLGTSNPRNYPNAQNFKIYQDLFSSKFIPNTLRQKFKDFYEFNKNIVDLLEKLLKLDPRERISAREALNHPWFKQHPLPSEAKEVLPSAQTPLNENWVKQQIEIQMQQAMKQQDLDNNIKKRKMGGEKRSHISRTTQKKVKY